MDGPKQAQRCAKPELYQWHLIKVQLGEGLREMNSNLPLERNSVENSENPSSFWCVMIVIIISEPLINRATQIIAHRLELLE